MPDDNKRSLVIVCSVLATILLIVAIIGFSMAAFSWQFNGRDNIIATGNVSMSLLESTNTIMLENALPMSDEEGKSLDHDSDSGVFDFAISTYASGSPGNITYSISISKEIVDSNYLPLANNQVKLYLTTFDDDDNEVQVMAPTLVSNIITSGVTGTLAFDSNKTTYLTHYHSNVNSTISQKYRLRMWISDNVDATEWDKDTKYQFKLKINTSGQIS